MDPITIADVFNSDLFSSTSLTAAINEIAYVPQRLSELGIFEVDGVTTTTVFIEKVGETLRLVPNTPRGGPGTSVAIDRRKAVPLTAAHLQLEDKIYADEVGNVRAFGSGNRLQGVQETRDARLLKMSRSLDLTLEYHRLGAIQGLVLDADGTTVIADLFDLFGISAPSDVDMNLDAGFNTTTSGAVIKPNVTGVLREIDVELGGYSPSGYYAFCGDDFFDALESHPELRETLKYQQGAQLREDGRRTFSYAGVTWENYRGVGAVKIADTEARLFPLGVPNLFQQYFAPTDQVSLSFRSTFGRVQ